jgi:30S ribosomal protein S31
LPGKGRQPANTLPQIGLFQAKTTALGLSFVLVLKAGEAGIKSVMRPAGAAASDTENGAMGKGDIRTKRGKIYRGTFGKTRPRKKKEAQKKG